MIAGLDVYCLRFFIDNGRLGHLPGGLRASPTLPLPEGFVSAFLIAGPVSPCQFIFAFGVVRVKVVGFPRIVWSPSFSTYVADLGVGANVFGYALIGGVVACAFLGGSFRRFIANLWWLMFITVGRATD